MNTNRLKPFAQQARNILMQGVKSRMLFWGFDDNGNVVAEPEQIPGGIIFRNELINDDTLFKKWERLKKQISNHTCKDATEEAAYTWFNRLMAIKILEKNNYENPVLQFSGAAETPAILDNARNGIMPFLNDADKQKVKEKILNGDDESAFGILLVGFCRKHSVLNLVFGGIDDYTELLLPNNMLSKDGIINLINKNGFVEEDDYKQVELIGWLYQFYISERKDEVFRGFKANKKARKEDIPAATQIFTPKWIVKYMVENTVGATWLQQYPESDVRSSLKYLVENKNNNTAATDTVTAAEITLLDPAVGSAHILVTAFDLYMLMYKEEGYTTRQAVREILKNNLFGLDIDKRAMQLARFAVLIKAAFYDPDILKENVLPHIYAMPEQYHFQKEDIEEFLSIDTVIDSTPVIARNEAISPVREDIQTKLPFPVALQSSYTQLREALHSMLHAQNLGSIMVFDITNGNRNHIETCYNQWKQKADNGTLNLNQQAWWFNLQQYLEPLLILTNTFSCVVANPPYMGQRSMNAELKNYVNENYPQTKSDLMTVFMEVIPSLNKEQGRFALINLPSWLFLSSFEEIRKHYVNKFYFESLLHMGRGIFGVDFGSVAFVIKKENAIERRGNYFRLHERNFQHIHYSDIEKLFLNSNNNPAYKYDFGMYRDEEGKVEIPFESNAIGLQLFYPNISQYDFSNIPGSPIAYWLSTRLKEVFKKEKPLGDVSELKRGMTTSDNDKFLRLWSEVNFKKIRIGIRNHLEAMESNGKWFPYNKGGSFRKWYGNNEFLVNWENNGYEVIEFAKSINKSYSRTIVNVDYFFRESITWPYISSSGFGVRFLDNGFIYDSGGPSLFLPNNSYRNFYCGLLNSSVVKIILPILNPTVNYQIADITRIPVILVEDKVIDKVTSNCLFLSKSDWDSRETSWDFQQSPLINNAPTLQQNFNHWHKKVSADFFQLHENEEALNKIFIDIYGLQDELTPDVPLKDITILQDELDYTTLENFAVPGPENLNNTLVPVKNDVVIQQLISYTIGCIFGRYRLDKPGLHIAHPQPSTEELKAYTYNNHNFEIDDDAIIPMMGTDSPFADNVVNRFKEFVQIVWGEKTLTENINFINACLGMEAEKFLTEKFWSYHNKVYQKKPIYWLFTSPGGSFKVLTYMHRMDKFTVQKIRLNYLHRYIDFLSSSLEQATINNTQQRVIDKMNRALSDCKAYDKILKPLSDLQITFDLDDGVTVNYEKFNGAVAPLR